MRVDWKSVAACAALWSLAGAALAQVSFKSKNILTGNGYSEKSLGGGVWRVRGTVGSAGGAEASAHMALLRGAELVQAAGYPYIQVLKSQTSMTTSTQGKRLKVHHFTSEVKVRGARGPRDNGTCEIRNRTVCPMWSVDFVLNNVGPKFAGDETSEAVGGR